MGKRSRPSPHPEERPRKRARTGSSWTLFDLARMIESNRRLYPPFQVEEREEWTLALALRAIGQEAERMDPVRPEVEWEDEAIASTTDPGADDCDTVYQTEPPVQEPCTSKVVLRRARRLYGRSYKEGEEVEVRRSRRLAMKPRVSYVGMC